MYFKIEVQMRTTGYPVVTKFDSDPSRIWAHLDKALHECGINRDPAYYLRVIDDSLRGAAPDASWAIIFVDLNNQIWIANFLRPDVNLGDIAVPLPKSRYKREPVI